MPNAKTHFLLTGANGFVGSHLTRRFVSSGLRVTALDRTGQLGNETLTLDLRHPQIESFLPNDVDVVVHCAAALPSHTRDEIFQTDVQAMLRLLCWARKIGVKHFIHVSSTAVYGPNHPPQVTEDHPVRAWDAYNSAKIRAEALVPQVMDGPDTRWTILRPKAIVGPGRLGLFGHLFDFAASGKRFPIIGNGSAIYQFLHIEDLLDAIERTVADSDAAHGKTLNIASRADHSIAELFQSVLDRAGHGKQLLRVPEMVARSTLALAHGLGISPVYSRLIHNLVNGSTVSLAAAEASIGFVPRQSGKAAIDDAFSWYLGNMQGQQNATLGNGHRQIWKSPLATLVKRFT